MQLAYTYSTGDWKDLLTGYNGDTRTYDGNGNLVSDGIWTYTCEHGRQLSSISQNGNTIFFAYDAEGKRISKSDGTNTFEYFYADGKLTRIKRNNTTLHFDYDMLGPSVIRYNGVDYYYHRNAQGGLIWKSISR